MRHMYIRHMHGVDYDDCSGQSGHVGHDVVDADSGALSRLRILYVFNRSTGNRIYKYVNKNAVRRLSRNPEASHWISRQPSTPGLDWLD